MKTNCASRRGARSYAAAAFALLSLLLWQAAEARAQWTTSGNTTSITNNVGVGTATPAQMFHVHSPGTWAGTRVTTAVTGSTVNDGVHFGYDDGYGAYVWNREAPPLIFATNNTERARFSAGGYFGIGTNLPSAKLHIISVDDTVAPALSVRTRTRSSALTSRWTRTSTATSRSTASTTGRAPACSPSVRVRVDATRAPVKVGDLLVTGDAPGVAMKSEPVVLGGRKMHSPGTIIGKALEPLKGGVGEILVLLSLQ